MKLKFQEDIDKIPNCPAPNKTGQVTLYRCVEEELTENSFIPNAVLRKPKLQNECIAWGLSLFSSFDSAKQMLNNLTRCKQVKYKQIAKAVINDSHGTKFSDKNNNHYTFFPTKEFNELENFEIVNRDE